MRPRAGLTPLQKKSLLVWVGRVGVRILDHLSHPTHKDLLAQTGATTAYVDRMCGGLSRIEFTEAVAEMARLGMLKEPTIQGGYIRVTGVSHKVPIVPALTPQVGDRWCRKMKSLRPAYVEVLGVTPIAVKVATGRDPEKLTPAPTSWSLDRYGSWVQKGLEAGTIPKTRGAAA